MEMKTRLLFVPLLLVLVASLAACGGGGGVPSDAVAVVNGTPITQAQYNAWLTTALKLKAKQSGGKTLTPSSPDYKAVQAGTVSLLVQFEEVKQAAEKLGVSVSSSEVSKGLNDLATTQFDGKMSKLLAYYNLTLPMAQEEEDNSLLQKKIYNKVISSAKVSTDEEKAYFNANRAAQYTTAAQTSRSVEYILVKKKALADSIEQQLRNGANFAKLAKKYNDPAHSPADGKFTAIKGQLVPAFDQSAFSLKTGELSQPVDATSAANQGYGWFVIRALAPVKNTPASTKSFAEVQASIHHALILQAQQKLWQQWIADFVKSNQGKVKYQAGYAPPTTTALPTTTAPAVTTG
jgi:parvulin-like peptidyl-prolyl isomerase